MRNKYGWYSNGYEDFCEEETKQGVQYFERLFFDGKIKVRVSFEFDEYSYPEYLGEYSDTEYTGSIDRKKRGDMGHNELRYFYPANRDDTYRYYVNEKGWHPRAARIEAGYVANQDYQRYEDFNAGHWHYVGVVVKLYVDGKKVAEDSLWGIESDSDKEYFWTTIRDCLSDCIQDYRKELKESLQHQQWAVKA